jgi:hypothetical protein
VKKQFIILIITLISTLTGFSQKTKKSAEIGLFFGGSYYIGDLNPVAHFNQFTKPAGGVVFRYNLGTRLALRASALFGNIEGHDSFSNSVADVQRNLSFKSSIRELSGQLEFNFLDYEIGNENRKFSPYIFLGLAVFKFSPESISDSGDGVSLQPLGTEGQGLNGGASSKKYKLTQLSIPFGIGIKTNLAKNIGLSLEWGMRKTYTDYLDDVSTTYYDPIKLEAARGVTAAILSDPSIGTDPNYSNVGRQRGNSLTKDWYAFAGAILSFKLQPKRKPCPSANN